jgi:hypothetical protein
LIRPSIEPPPQSTDEILFSGLSSGYQDHNASITSSNLYPDTNYSVYCVAVDLFGVSTLLAEVMETSKQFKTICCKQMIVELNQQFFPSHSSTMNAVTISVDSPSVFFGGVSILAHRRGHSELMDLFTPNYLSFQPTQSISPLSLTLSKTVPGDYVLVLIRNVSRFTPFEYHFSFFVTQNFTILSSLVEPPVPQVLFSRFQDDGLTVMISFNSPIDQSSLSREFNCSLVLSFLSSANSLCLFRDPVSLIISLPPTTPIVVNSSMNFVKDSLRAHCELSLMECTSWKSVSDVSFNVQTSKTPLVPVVRIRGLHSITECDNPFFDVDLSDGSGGRAWSSLKVTVVSSAKNKSIVQLEDFFAEEYNVNDPQPVPSGLFHSNHWYLLRFTLCNFLQNCGSGDHLVTVTSSTSVPSILLLNPRQLSLHRSSPLVLEVMAWTNPTAQCRVNDSKVFQGLIYEWSIVRNQQTVTLESSSPIPSKFMLPANSLETGSLYQFRITVTHQVTSLSSSDIYLVKIVPSPLIATITGSTRRSIQIDRVVSVDGSRSQDPDLLSSTLNFVWACTRVKPEFSRHCGITQTEVSRGVIAISGNDSLIGDQYNITLTVSDAARQASTSILIDISPPDDPLVSITSPTPDLPWNRWNPVRDLTLFGKITISTTARAEWHLEDNGVSLVGKNRTRLFKTLTPGVNLFNFVLKGGSLPSSSLPYVFTLLVDGFTSKTSVQVLMNSPPRPGRFVVSPPDGTTFVTQFRLISSQWIDSDLPLGYQFSYTSGGRSLPLRSLSPYNSLSSFLPAGLLSENEFVSCEVVVLDSYDARASAIQPVLVRIGQSVSTMTLSQTISSKLLQAEGNHELVRQVISISGSLINLRNCSGTPSCASLSREECSTTDHLCGPCLSQRLGTGEDGNTFCPPIEFDSQVRKECDEQCGQHGGNCLLENIDSGLPIPICSVTDITCRATCVCPSGRSGLVCEITDLELQNRMALRTDLLRALKEFIESDEITGENVRSWAATLSVLSRSTNELSGTGITLISEIAELVMASSPSSSTLLELFDSLDSVFRPSNSHTRRRLQSDSLDSYSLVTRAATMLTESLVPQENGDEVIEPSFRISSPILSSSSPQLALSQSPLERLSNLPITSCSAVEFRESSDTRVSMVSVQSKYFHDHPLSNSLSLLFTNQTLQTLPSFICVLANTFSRSFTNEMSPEYHNVTCLEGDFSIHERQCVSIGNVTISVACNGSAVHLSQRCPHRLTQPACVSFGKESSFQCTQIGFNSTSTTCYCNTTTTAVSSSRRLSSSDPLLQVLSLPH